jgi:hypothetical protein
VSLLQEPSNNAYDHRYQNTKQDHGCNGKIEAEIFFFYTNITGQMTDPMQFIVKEIDDQSYYHHCSAEEYYVLAGIGIHKKFILNIPQCFCR